MSDPALPLEAAIVAKLKADAGVTALAGTRVYDSPPVSPTFPYVTIGPTQVLPDKADCIDGTEVFQQIDVWSRTSGSPGAKRLGAAVVAALDDQDLTVAGYSAVVFELQDAQYLLDPDGLTHHGVVNFRALLQLA